MPNNLPFIQADGQRLERLHRAIRRTGLVADLSRLDPGESSLVVSNRLAQTTIRFLRDRVDAEAASALCEELRGLGGAEEFTVLTDETGYTFYHVVQYLYEFARQAAPMPDSQDFCEGMGYGGGGIEVAPHREVISLVTLLISALSPKNDAVNVGVLVSDLFPQILGRIFPVDLLEIEVSPRDAASVTVSLRYADRQKLRDGLDRLDLARDTGHFFLNSALHIQGTMQLAWDTFAQDPGRHIDMGPRLQELDEAGRRQVAEDGTYTWSVEWQPEIQLGRLTDDAEVLARTRTILEALQLRDHEYYIERIKTLELRIQELQDDATLHQMVGRSERMRQVHTAIDQVAASHMTVLIRGESGTGKELVARAIHASSPRAEGPLVAANCAAFTESLLESELFGHEKGAFTGADRQKLGRFELAHGGTLFLDEIGDISLATQVKLLRVLETRTFERVGGTATIESDVRIIGATNRDLERLIEEGDFREDLYFRLNVLPIEVPPLRDHREDIPEMVQHFLERIAERSGKPAPRLTRGAVQRLVEHTWPGNVRDLQNVIERAVVLYATGDTLSDRDIQRALGLQSSSGPSVEMSMRQRFVLQAVDDAGFAAVDDLLDVVTRRVGRGGTSRRTLQNDLRRLSNQGYLVWHKEGSARSYELTTEGKRVLRALLATP